MTERQTDRQMFRAVPIFRDTLHHRMFITMTTIIIIIIITRSYAALRAADLDWIVGPGYSLGRVHSGEKP